MNLCVIIAVSGRRTDDDGFRIRAPFLNHRPDNSFFPAKRVLSAPHGMPGQRHLGLSTLPLPPRGYLNMQGCKRFGIMVP